MLMLPVSISTTSGAWGMKTSSSMPHVMEQGGSKRKHEDSWFPTDSATIATFDSASKDIDCNSAKECETAFSLRAECDDTMGTDEMARTSSVKLGSEDWYLFEWPHDDFFDEDF